MTELYVLGSGIGSKIAITRALSKEEFFEIDEAICRFYDKDKALKIILKIFTRLDMSVPDEIIENIDNYEVISHFVLGIYSGYLRLFSRFRHIISLSDACEKYNKSENDLMKNIENNIFFIGTDCELLNLTWFFDIDALEREYNK
ncbi:TPA: hypothetical protein ACKOR7_003046 [Clostridioides difficile]